MSYGAFETEGSGEMEEQTSIILNKNKLGYLLPILVENNTNFDELIEFEDEDLQMWLPEISDKFRHKLDKIRFLKSIKEYRKLKYSANSSLSPSPQQQQSSYTPVQIVTIDTETTAFCNSLNDQISKTQKAITNLEKSIDTLSDLQQSKREFVEQECNAMITKIHELKNKILIPKIDEICLNKINTLQNQMNSFKVYLKKLNNAQQKVNAALRNISFNNKTRKAKIISPIKGCINEKISFYPNVSPFIDVEFNASQFSQQMKKNWDICATGKGKPYHDEIEWLQCGSGSNDILLSWKISNASKPILESINGYIVYYRVMNADDEKCDDDDKDISNFIQDAIEDTASPTSHSLTDLKEATTYKMLVCSYNKYGTSVLSAPLVMKTNDKLSIKTMVNQQQLIRALPRIEAVEQLFVTMKSQNDFSDKLLDVFSRVDRKLFVPEDEKAHCCSKDSPININYGVSLSAPHIHIYALKQFEYLLESTYGDAGVKFLDVGCGTGYVASLMAVALLLNMNINKSNVTFKAYGCVYHPQLLKQAQNACKRMDLSDILSFHQSDTNVNDIGLKKESNFDGIYCGAAITKHDATLLRQQLKIGGQLMCVVETDANSQDMKLVKRINKQNYQETKLFGVRFRTLRGRFQYL